MKGLAIAAIGVGFAMGACYATGLRCNTTPSMPRGIWRVQSIQSPILRGEIVTLCLEPAAAALGRERGYLTGGECPGDMELLIKTVAAVPGDQVEVTGDGLTVNEEIVPNSKPLPVDEAGREMTSVDTGSYIVGEGEVWVISSHDVRSYDSRYFGSVPIANIRGTARPVWINQ